MTDKITDTTSGTVTDASGRTLELRLMTVLEQLDFFEAAGTNANNQVWLSMAMLAATVRSIDGNPVPMPTNRAQIRYAVGRLGPVGIEAIQKALMPEESDSVDVKPKADGADIVVDTAKN